MSKQTQNSPFKPLKIGPDGWAQGVFCGEYPIDRPDSVLDPEAAPDAYTPITEIVSPEDCDAMIAAWEADGRPLLLVDADHSADLSDNTAAYFWVSELRRCPDGLEVLLQPTKLGQSEVVEGRVWRFLSPAFPWSGYVYDDEAKTLGHPRLLTNFGLTNLPRMRGIRPVVNSARPAPAAVHQTTPNPTKGASMDYKTMLCKLLGLDPASTDEQIQTAADAALGSQAEKEAEEAMNGCGIPADKTARNALAAIFKGDKAAGLNAIKAAAGAVNAAKAAAPSAEAAQRALHKEAKGKAPTALNAGRFGAKSAALNSVMAANPGLSRSDAYAIAKRQNPEAFA